MTRSSEFYRQKFVKNNSAFEYAERDRSLINQILDYQEEGKTKQEILKLIKIREAKYRDLMKQHKQNVYYRSIKHSNSSERVLTKEAFLKSMAPITKQAVNKEAK